MVCTFFGHHDCYELDASILKNAIEELIHKGADTFYVGHQGHFDAMVFHASLELEKIYPNISISVVLAYLPTRKGEYDPYQGYSLYPEIEDGPPRFAIVRRNKWMIERARAGYCLCCVRHTWGSAYKFAKRAKSMGLKIVNVGSTQFLD